MKATVGFVAFLCLVGAGLSILFLATWETQARALSRHGAMQAAAALADAVAIDVSRGDVARARAALESRARHDPSLVLAVLSDASGELVRLDEHCPEAVNRAVADGPAPARDATRIRLVPAPDGPVLDMAIPLPAASGSDADGRTLRLAFALAPRAAQILELRWRVTAITLAMLVLGTAGAMFLVSRLLGPLPDLVRDTERIADGDLEHVIRVEADDEIGTLARTINNLTRELRRWQDRQHTWSRELESRVEDKTREIAETREHLSNIVENVGASILVADLDGTVVSANTHTMHIFGTKPEFAVGRRLDEFAGEVGAKPEVLLAALSRGNTRVNETRIQAGDGTVRDLLVIHTLLRDTGGHAAGFLQIAKDVTDLKQMERRLVHSERLSAMGEMAGEIGHELNNYLMAIGGRAELIVAALGDGTDPRRIAKIRRGAEIIAEQVGEMRRLTDGLLDASRKESSPTDVDLTELVERTIEFVRPQNRFDGITIELTKAEGPLHVWADPQQIRQVVLNLLTNAAEATRERIDRGGTIRVATARGTTSASVQVCDEGPGIAESVRERIFEPHFTTKAKGHGFGLAVCHRVVANHGGSIHAESPRNGGAVFTVKLPLPPDPSRGAEASPGRVLDLSSPLPFPGIAAPSNRSARP